VTTGAGESPPPDPRPALRGPVSTPRRQLATSVVACALGAVLALLTAARTWRVVSGKGPVPLPSYEVTGTQLLPWLPAVALVGLAGAGALLAVRGRARSVLGLLLAATGLPLVAAAVYGVGTAAGDRLVFPVLLGLGGLLITFSGGGALLRGASWPTLGGRYDRPTVPHPVEQPVEPVERSNPSRSDVAMWDALDRGEDPTSRGS
jgi:hypothetical protein